MGETVLHQSYFSFMLLFDRQRRNEKVEKERLIIKRYLGEL